MEFSEITKEQFNAYEQVRKSGVTNMFGIQQVEELSGLDKETILVIMENYEELKDKFITKQYDNPTIPPQNRRRSRVFNR